MKFSFVHQLETNDCGPACLSMVSKFHGKDLSLQKTKELCGITRMGVSVKDLLDGGRRIGFDSHGIKLSVCQLEEVPLPAILFWRQDHYVVLYQILSTGRKKHYLIADPSYGKTKVDEEVLKREWIGNNTKGVCLVYQPGESFDLDQYETSSLLKSKSTLIANYLIQFARKNRWSYASSICLLLIGLAANWVSPLLFKRIIDEGVSPKSFNIVIILLLCQFALFLGNTISQFSSDILLTKFNFKLAIDLKEKFLNKLVQLPVNYFDSRLNTETLQRMVDLSRIQQFLTWKGISLVINILNIIVFTTMLYFLNKVVFLVFIILSVISVVWIAIFLRRRSSLEYSMSMRQADNNNNLYEFVMNMPEIKVNRAHNVAIERILAVQKKLNVLELKSLYLNMYQMSGANFVSKLKETAIIAVCAYLIIESKMTIGTLMSISYIVGQLSSPIIGLIGNVKDGQDAYISRTKIDDVLEVANEVKPDVQLQNPLVMADISLQNLSFKYPGSFNPFVIKDISFTIPKDKITAIVGSSGSGKTTLMKLLMRYYNPTAGCIQIGKTLFSEHDPDDWRERCGVVLQDGQIFSGSIEFNIALCEAEGVNYERMGNAIRISCLDEFVNSLPLKMETKIGNVGIQLSGGQRQRILIARAIYKNPEFIFFDEATSSLDANTEYAIMNNLNEFFKGRTVIVVAHRLSTVRNADQIIVIENGEMMEQGTHHELVLRQNRYYSLVRNQLELES